MRSTVATSIILMMSASLPARADEPAVIPLAKVGNWNVNYTPDSCQLIGLFGNDAQRVILNLTREQPGDTFGLELFGQLVKAKSADPSVELTFGLDGKPFTRSGVPMSTITSSGKLPLVGLSGLRLDDSSIRKQTEPVPSVTLAREAAVTAITFKMAGGKRYRLETGSMGQPMAAMRTCTDDLIKSWGFDPKIEGTLTRHAAPVGSPSAWLTNDDYPTAALREGNNGLIQFRLDVDAKGMPQGCRVLHTTSPDVFADLSCKLLLQRARFQPALDGSGKPVKSFYINSVRWLVPED